VLILVLGILAGAIIATACLVAVAMLFGHSMGWAFKADLGSVDGQRKFAWRILFAVASMLAVVELVTHLLTQ
jgi:hypothetical protein